MVSKILSTLATVFSGKQLDGLRVVAPDGAEWVRLGPVLVQVAGAVETARAEPTVNPADGGLNLHLANASLPLPTGAATEATLAAASAKLPATLGAKAPTAALGVTGPLATSMASLPDITAGAVTAFGDLAAGPTGILVTNHPTSTTNVRVSGADTDATHGQPIAPGQSVIFCVSNANVLKHIAESGGPKLCVSAV